MDFISFASCVRQLYVFATFKRALSPHSLTLSVSRVSCAPHATILRNAESELSQNQRQRHSVHANSAKTRHAVAVAVRPIPIATTDEAGL